MKRIKLFINFAVIPHMLTIGETSAARTATQLVVYECFVIIFVIIVTFAKIILTVEA